MPAIIPLLCERDVEIAAAVAAALERYGALARPAIPELAKAAGPGDHELRIAAMRALMATGSPGAKATPEFIQALSDNNRRVRLQAVQTLGFFGPLVKEAAPALKATAHNDTDTEIRREASDALIKVLGN